MKENPIKLSQIITQKQLRDKKRGSLHALNNSFKRNALMTSESATKYQSSYECKLPEVNFSRRDLSIILRYLLFKQEMQPCDRNLLRRILLGIFQQQLISAGSKNFVNYLKLVEGANMYDINQEEKQFYFVLKGNGMVTSGKFSYYVKPGDTFGQVQILSNEKIQKIQFASKFLLLKLEERYFNQYFKQYYEKIHNEKQAQLSCIKQNFLDKIPLLNKYLFFNKIQYKTFSPSQKIVIEGEALKILYFIGNNGSVSNVSNKCIGLSQLLRQRQVVRQTIYCNKKVVTPYIDIQIFTQYVLNSCNNSFLMNQSSAFDKFKINNNTRSSFEAPQVIRNFMNVKIVKLKMNRSRLKTEASDFCQTSFKFFKQNQNRTSLNPQKNVKDSRPLTRSRYQRTNYAAFPKPLKNNYF